MTYAEKQGHMPFDWEAFLLGNPTQEQVGAAVLLAESWFTCPVGNCSADIERYTIKTPVSEHQWGWPHEPVDDQLRYMGNAFPVFISGWYRNYCDRENVDKIRALQFLYKIRRREAQLLSVLVDTEVV